MYSRYAALYQQQHDIASEDIQTYVANPINAYLLVKRLTTDWKQVENLIAVDFGKGKWKCLTIIEKYFYLVSHISLCKLTPTWMNGF